MRPENETLICKGQLPSPRNPALHIVCPPHFEIVFLVEGTHETLPL